MKQIKIRGSTQHAIVDDENYFRCLQHNWALYNWRRPRIVSSINNVQRSLAGFIMNTRKLVDHIDRDIYNNQRLNLRFVTATQSSQNRDKCLKDTASRFKGVSWHNNKCWQATITVNKKKKYLGLFDIEENAAKAYDEAAKKYFKNYAALNFPIIQ